VEEKARLTAGLNMFTMRGNAGLGIPDLRVTDGPNGARGSSILGSGEARAVCVPSGSALGATWNTELIERIGELLGDETRTKKARVLLAPTVNLHRSPLAGRNFECFSEDPLLSGKAAAAYVRGVQSRGVITTVKHFVGNDAETDRYTISSVIDERTLRELYLVPFELAVKEGRSAGIMTAYNRLNGKFCTEDRHLLEDILRGEWGFDGIVMTDWFGAGDTVASAEAGLDVEMPAGDRVYGAPLAQAVLDGRVDESRLHAIVERQLRAVERVGALDDEGGTEQSIDRPEHRALARIAATEAMVLLRNEGVLPFDMARVKTLAVVGPNAARPQIMGGGSANLRPHHRTTPLDALHEAFGDEVEIVHRPGWAIDRAAPLLSGSEIAIEGQQGFVVDIFASTNLSGPVAGKTTRDTSRLLFMDDLAPGVSSLAFSARARTIFTPQNTCPHEFEIVQINQGRVLLDGVVIVDGVANPSPRSAAFFGFGSEPISARVDLISGRAYELVIEVFGDTPQPIAGLDFGCRAILAGDPIAEAVEAARNADAVVIMVGTNAEWETEGEDRTSMDLPGAQNELIDAVLAVNPKAVVVVNTGSPVTMDWADRAPAILQCWFGGQEMSSALTDVLTGVSEPGGRLPTTIPLRVEHNPSFGNFPGANGAVHYGEGVFIGYRWYESRHLPVRFPFGHGLSYTTFTMGAPVLSSSTFTSGAPSSSGTTLQVSVAVTNTGTRRGSHVVQCYVIPAVASLDRPALELKAFAKVTLDPGQTTNVHLTLDDRSFAYWDPARPEWPDLRARLVGSPFVGGECRTTPGWTIEPGTYGIAIANSVADVVHRVYVSVT
jgi:beta-glucosidase